MPSLACINHIHRAAPALQDSLAQIERLGCGEIVCARKVVNDGLLSCRDEQLHDRHMPTVQANPDDCRTTHPAPATYGGEMKSRKSLRTQSQLVLVAALAGVVDELRRRARALGDASVYAAFIHVQKDKTQYCVVYRSQARELYADEPFVLRELDAATNPAELPFFVIDA